ncbi:hypothetical protein EYF80_032349 [Liparis tanakae]|uniref:Uncharacterized protein n=1 Tax=Liparis tanakae TaxID=230148 RepID=A0A4Z2GVR1_9TELE|nr:hypothetical protein EYF80_032349 [Liparis tanakae]
MEIDKRKGVGGGEEVVTGMKNEQQTCCDVTLRVGTAGVATPFSGQFTPAAYQTGGRMLTSGLVRLHRSYKRGINRRDKMQQQEEEEEEEEEDHSLPTSKLLSERSADVMSKHDNAQTTSLEWETLKRSRTNKSSISHGFKHDYKFRKKGKKH